MRHHISGGGRIEEAEQARQDVLMLDSENLTDRGFTVARGLIGADQAARHGEAAIGEIPTVEHQDILPRPGFFFYPPPA